jgi:hypothetical protein
MARSGGYAVYPGGHGKATLGAAKKLAKQLSETTGSSFIDRVSDGKRMWTYHNGVPRKGNPSRRKVGSGLPIGRFIKVKAIRRKNGRVDLYRA